jgi:hypothetical protein
MCQRSLYSPAHFPVGLTHFGQKTALSTAPDKKSTPEHGYTSTQGASKWFKKLGKFNTWLRKFCALQKLCCNAQKTSYIQKMKSNRHGVPPAHRI